MTKLLIRLCVPRDCSEQKKRLLLGQLAGFVGLAANILLCVLKFSIGIVTHSIAVMADAINNMSDALSSVISLAGFRMAAKAPDQEHPFGHGRMEYIAALFVSMLVIFAGFQFMKSSVERIISPEPVVFSWLTFGLLALSLPVKLWLGLFDRHVGNEIRSQVLLAAMQDSINDVITTSVVLFGMLAAHFTPLPVDGYVGALVALFILYGGYGLAKDAISPLIGEKADPMLAKRIQNLVLSYDGILGVHDLIIHSYGEGHCFASVHAEVPSDGDILTIHETIDAIEQQAMRSLHIFLVIHMDPIQVNDERVQLARTQTEHVLQSIDDSLTMHDFRMVDGQNQINLIFDVVVDHNFVPEELRENIRTELQKIDARYHPVIVFDHTM